MQFDRHIRAEPLTMTQRKILAFQRKQARERARYPLFPEHIANEQPTLKTDVERREASYAKTEANMRQFIADTWRASRSAYFAQPADIRAVIMAEWCGWTGPRASTYFAWMVDKHSGDLARRVAKYAADFEPIRKRIWEQAEAQRPRLLDASTE